jgi:hypothetical protein
MSLLLKRRLLSLLGRVFAPGGRHLIGAAPPPPATPIPGPSASPSPTVLADLPALPDEASDDAVLAAETSSAATHVPAAPATIRLIFTDGSVVLLPEASIDGRQAQYLARRVLEASRHL